MATRTIVLLVAVMLLSGLGSANAAMNPRAYSGSGSRSEQQRKIEFLHRIRQSDPSFQTIEKAVFNSQNELGIVLNRRVDLDSIRPLVKSVLTQMAKEFPNQDLTVVVYGPSTPPVKIGTGRLDVRTRAMSYQPARR